MNTPFRHPVNRTTEQDKKPAGGQLSRNGTRRSKEKCGANTTAAERKLSARRTGKSQQVPRENHYKPRVFPLRKTRIFIKTTRSATSRSFFRYHTVGTPST